MTEKDDTTYLSLNCPLCNSKLSVKENNKFKKVEEKLHNNLGKKDFYTIEEIIDMDLVRSMEDNIKSVGHKRTWEAIESITNAKQRGIFRLAFQRAGGIIPESKIKYFNGWIWNNKK